MRRAMFAVLFTSSLLASTARSPGLFDPLWGFLSAIWSGATADAGCGFDPYGHCGSAPQPTPDAGCTFDPYSVCTPGS